MRKILFLLVVGGFGGGVCFGQATIIAQWNFNSVVSDGNVNTGNSNASRGSGTLTRILTGFDGYFNGSSTDPNTTDNSDYSIQNFPTASSSNKMAGIKIMTSTVGFNSIKLNFDHKNSNTSANTLVVQYSLNDVDYFDVPGASFTVTNNNYVNDRIADLGSIPAVNNISNLYLKIVTAFVGGAYQPTNSSSTYASSGNIRFDMVTVSGITTTCSGNPTTQASGLILNKTDASNMTLAFNRGNGTGCIVVAREGAAVSATPVNGTSYTANAVYGSGSQIGTGNFVVANSNTSGAQQFTVTGLTAGSKYYFAIYEYSQTGYCYLTPGFTYSATCNNTVLFPGDMLIVGFDNAAESGGTDRYAIATLVDLKKGTTFSLVNSRFEAGAIANSRTNKWRGQGTDPFQDPGILSFVYNGSSVISKGTIINFEFSYNAQSIELDGNGTDITSSFDRSSNLLGTSGFLTATGTDADQIYLVSGYYTAYGNNGTTKYNNLTGNTLCGISNRIPWIPFSMGVSETVRESRIPPQINCINIPFTSTTNGFAYLNTGISHSGTKAQIIANFTNSSNWTFGTGNSMANDIVSGVLSTRFTVNASNPDGQWNGSSNSDWFNCSNWEGLRVPEFVTQVTIPDVTNDPEINNEPSTKAAEFERYAVSDTLTILNNGSVSLKGTEPDRLFTFGPINIAASGKLQFENTAGSLLDTLYLKNNLVNNGSINNGFIPGVGTVAIDNNFSNSITQLTSPNDSLRFNNLAILNNYGAMLTSITNTATKGLLFLGKGIISTGSNTFSLYKSASVLSPINSYNETDNGWIGSFISGKVVRESDNTATQKFPIGKLVGATPYYAPCALTPVNNILRKHAAEYFPDAPFNLLNIAAPPLDHISQREYWEISCDSTSVNALAVNTTFYWSPYSLVGPGSLSDLRIAHYFDDDGTNTYPDRWAIDASSSSFTTIGDLSYGTIKNNGITTTFSPFTFGSVSLDNILPIQLLSFQALPQNKTIKLQWQVLDETDAAYYTIEKSTDGRNFSFLQKLQAKHIAGIADYNSYDTKPAEGWNYYRLVITNKQGKSFTYKTEKLWMGSSKQLLVYPNPTTNKLNIVLPNVNGSLILLNAAGKQVMQISNNSLRNMEIAVEQLPRGMYLLQYCSATAISSQKIILR